MLQIKYAIYCVRCQINNEIPWDFITWAYSKLYIKEWR